MKENYNSYLTPTEPSAFSFDNKGKQVTGTYLNFSAKTDTFPVKTSRDAIALSFFLSRQVKAQMDKLIANADEAQRKKIYGTRDWLNKKAIYHPHGVRKEMDGMVSKPTFIDQAQKSGLTNPSETLEKMRIISATHDIGRFSEINISNGTKFDLTSINGKGKDHGYESYAILKSLGVTDPTILLPVKYHGVKDLAKEQENDSEYSVLSTAQKKEIDFLSHTIRDADKISNLETYTITGVKKCGEMNNPDYHGNFEISEPVLQAFYNKETVPAKETHTYLDTMLKFASWLYDINFDFNKERAVSHILNPLFDRIYEQARDEWNDESKKRPQNTTDFERYKKTLETLQGCQSFITKEMGGKMNQNAWKAGLKDMTPPAIENVSAGQTSKTEQKPLDFTHKNTFTYIFGKGIVR